MSPSPRPICEVCHQPLQESDQYLVRLHPHGMTAVHRNLCFPPARTAEPKPPLGQRAAA